MAQHPIYVRMNFPDYVFREYPKHIQTTEGKFLVVESAAEELKLAPEIFAAREAANEAMAKAELGRQDVLKKKLMTDLMPEMEQLLRDKILAEMKDKIRAEVLAETQPSKKVPSAPPRADTTP